MEAELPEYAFSGAAEFSVFMDERQRLYPGFSRRGAYSFVYNALVYSLVLWAADRHLPISGIPESPLSYQEEFGFRQI